MDAPELFASLGIDYKRHGESSEVTANFVGTRCPLCSPHGDRYKLGFAISSPYVGSCWTCGKVKLWDFLDMSGVPRQTIKERFGHLEKGIPFKKMPAGKYVLPGGVQPMMEAHRKYLKGRGFDPDVIESCWGVQAIGNYPGGMKWRLFIPITWRGKPASWTSRTISKHYQPKYWSAKPDQEVYSNKTLLYGHDQAGHACIVVEGPFDVWAIGHGAVATLGTEYTQSQITKLARFHKRVICFDSSVDAQRRARSLADQLAVFDGETVVVELDSPDPGSADSKELTMLRKLIR